MNLLSHLIASLHGALHSGLVLAQFDEGRSESRPVGDAGEEKFGGLVELVLETLLSDLEDVGDVHHTKEVLHVEQTVGLRLCASKFNVNPRLAKRLAGHLEVPDKVVVLASVICDLDNSSANFEGPSALM